MLWRTFWIILQNRDKMKKKKARSGGEGGGGAYLAGWSEM
jgi:hypothetical protein